MGRRTARTTAPAYTFFQYLWEQAGGNGDGTYDARPATTTTSAGDLLIKRIFEEQADGMDGVQNAIDDFNAETGSRPARAEELFQDWAVAVYLDDEDVRPRCDIKAVDFGDRRSDGWTIDIADDEFWDGRGSNQGAQPAPKWDQRANGQAPTRGAVRHPGRALPQPGPDRDVALRR